MPVPVHKANRPIPTLAKELELDEGRRRVPYKDSKGIWTAGVGVNLEALGMSEKEIQELIRKGGWSDAAIDHHLDQHIKVAIARCDRYIPWWRYLPGEITPEGHTVRARCMINLMFNMGWGDGKKGLSTFNRPGGTLEAIRLGNYQKAGANLGVSKWASEVKTRADRLIPRLVTGQYWS